jgi:hypothetical protein
MEDNELGGFSWSGLFIVTACCSFIFNVIVKVLDGDFSNLLFLIAGITAFLGIVSWGGKVLMRQYNKKRRNRHLTS